MLVSEKLANEVFTIEFWHIASLLLSLAVNYYIYLKARKTPVLYAYLVTQLMNAIWMVSKIFKTVAPVIGVRWFFIVMQYFGASFLGSALLIFASIYAKRGLPAAKHYVLWNLPALCCFLIVATNPSHHLFYTQFTFYKDSFGPLFYSNMIVSYSYIAISTILLGRGFLNMFGTERKRAYLFVIGIIAPLVINVLYAFGLFKTLFNYRPLFDYTPIATNISLAAFALAALKYRFVDILPMANQQVLDATNDAIAMYDKNGHLLRLNRSFSDLFPALHRGDLIPEELAFSANGAWRQQLKLYKVISQRRKHHTVVRMVNATELDYILAQLEEKNNALSNANCRLEKLASQKQSLVALKTRNFILQELHDVLGHTMVLAISACEAEILGGAKNYDATILNIERLLVESKVELDHIFNTQHDVPKRTSLLIALEMLAKKTQSKQLNCDITVMGEVFELPGASSDAIYRMCREAITNAIKHSHASVLNLVLRYNEEHLEVFAIDNGLGCKRIRKGRGLSGIEAHIKQAGGNVLFSSDEGCGFHIHAQVPRRAHAL